MGVDCVFVVKSCSDLKQVEACLATLKENASTCPWSDGSGEIHMQNDNLNFGFSNTAYGLWTHYNSNSNLVTLNSCLRLKNCIRFQYELMTWIDHIFNFQGPDRCYVTGDSGGPGFSDIQRRYSEDEVQEKDREERLKELGRIPEDQLSSEEIQELENLLNYDD